MTRIIVVKDGTVLTPQARALADEARAAFPALRHDATEQLFPHRRGVGRCRICGEQRELTREHVPPRAAFNKERGRVHSLLEWLSRTAEGVLPGGILRQGGNWGYTLCGPCNNFIGHEYADEYTRMAVGIVNTFVGENVLELDARPDQPIAGVTLTGNAPGSHPRPGMFVREVLALMCTMSADLDLAGRYPAIRRMILEAAVEPLPDGMSLGMTAYFHKDSRFAGPALEVLPDEGIWRFVMEVAHRPLAVLMVLATNGPAPHVCDISSFTDVAPDEQKVIEASLAIGFGHTILPGDYRTRAMVEADAAPVAAHA